MIGSVSGHDVRHPGRRWRTSRREMAYIIFALPFHSSDISGKLMRYSLPVALVMAVYSHLR